MVEKICGKGEFGPENGVDDDDDDSPTCGVLPMMMVMTVIIRLDDIRMFQIG